VYLYEKWYDKEGVKIRKRNRWRRKIGLPELNNEI
jgi:hypothetical protein